MDRPLPPAVGATTPTPAPPATLRWASRRVRAAHLVRLAGICLACGSWPGAAPSQELIANQDLAQGALTQNEARLYFTLRRQQWPDARPVRVFVLPDDNPLHAAFVKTVLGLFPYQLRGVWDRQVFSGTGQAPTLVANETEMIQRVAATPGAVGYVSSPPRDPRVRTLEVR